MRVSQCAFFVFFFLHTKGELHLLQEFYKDRDMNAQPFQTIVFDTHVDVVQEAMERARVECGGKDIVLVVERTMYDQLLFWKLQVDDKLKSTTPIFDAAYMRIWRKWTRFLPPVSLIFFLRTSDLQRTMQRLKKREESIAPDRSVFHVSMNGEQIEEVGGITLAYQEALLKKHEAWYTQPFAHPPESSPQGIRCVHINADDPYHEEDASLFQMAHEMCGSIAQMMMQ